MKHCFYIHIFCLAILKVHFVILYVIFLTWFTSVDRQNKLISKISVDFVITFVSYTCFTVVRLVFLRGLYFFMLSVTLPRSQTAAVFKSSRANFSNVNELYHPAEYLP